jgi:hypothetical protein
LHLGTVVPRNRNRGPALDEGPSAERTIDGVLPGFASRKNGYTGRFGRSAVFAALWLIDQKKEWFGFIPLFLSLGVRTDSVLLLLAVLAWLAWQKRISFYIAALLALFAVALVLGIDHWAGNYGWVVLFRFSFIAGRYPSQIPHTLSLGECLSVFAGGIGVLLTQLSLWILGLWAWMRRPSPLLIVASVAVVLHFVLFPSPEARYHMWAALVAAVALIQSFAERSLRQKA